MKLDVVFCPDSSALAVEFGADQGFVVGFGQLTEVSPDDREHYMGNYDVVPGREATVLETAAKVMDDDVTVHPIPYFQVSNLSGGKTVYIGGPGEINITRRKTNGKQ